MQLNIFFWNIGRKDLSDTIKHISNGANIIVLVEDYTAPNTILNSLNEKENKYRFISKNKRNTSIYTTIGTHNIKLKDSKTPYLLLTEINISESKPLLFGAIHNQSKLFQSNSSQSYYARRIIKELDKIENEVGHTNTLLVGDFNMNPFEYGMVSPEGFNAVMAREIAKTNIRKIGVDSYKYFYNPMWSYMGDLSHYSPGTYYFPANTHDNHLRWHMLDQILIRPSIISNFDEKSIKIIEVDSVGKSLITMGKKSKVLSDHLPVSFSINI